MTSVKGGGGRGLGLARRLIVVCVGLYLVVAGLFIGIESLTTLSASRKETLGQIDALALENVPALAQVFWSYDIASVSIILRGILANPSVGAVELIDALGTVSDDIGSFVSKEGSELGPERRYPLYFKRQGMDPAFIGTLVIRPSLEDERERVRDTILFGLGRTALIVAALSLILALAVERYFGRPLRDLARQVAGIGASPRGPAIVRPAGARGELALVADSLGAMAARVGETVAALTESEARLRSYFENSPISIWEEDFSEPRRRVDQAAAEGVVDWGAFFAPREVVADFASLIKIVDVNRATLELFGYADKADILGAASRALDDEELASLRLGFTALAGGRGSFETESARRTASGELVYVQSKLSVMPGYEGSWARVLVSIVDLSRLKSAERALRESEAKYRGLVEQSSEGLILLDAEGTIVDCNSQVERAAERADGSLAGTKVWDLEFDTAPQAERTEEARLRIRAKWVEALASCGAGRPAGPFETGLSRSDGSRRVIEQAIYGIRMDSLFMIGCILRDVTEQRMAARALMGSLREKELLLQEVHHRVKNNLQIICSLINLQLDKEGESSAMAAALIEIETRIRSISLVHELLYQSDDFARVDFPSYVRQLVDYLAEAYAVDRRRVRIEVSAGEESLPIDKAIPCGLILNELVVNALKHAFPDGRSGRIGVAVGRASEGAAFIEVADDGVGPEREETRERGRVSIGLSLVQNLASQLGGRVETSDGVGVAIRVVFPL
jgi:PAS domain S-box-containing protein